MTGKKPMTMTEQEVKDEMRKMLGMGVEIIRTYKNWSSANKNRDGVDFIIYHDNPTDSWSVARWVLPEVQA